MSLRPWGVTNGFAGPLQSRRLKLESGTLSVCVQISQKANAARAVGQGVRTVNFCMSYCQFVKTNTDPKKEVHRAYHDEHYGFPIHDDDELFERLVLEINQAGLSWETILKKQATFRKAYSNFSVTKVARYGEKDRERLLQDAGIIRNRLKVNAVIENAKVIVALQKEYGSFEHWLQSQHPKTKGEWVRLFKKHFKFTGGEIVNEFLMSIGYLPGAHTPECPAYKKILKAKPLWKKHEAFFSTRN